MHTLRSLLLSVNFLLILLTPAIAFCQYDWDELPLPPSSIALNGCYFITEEIGFLHNVGGGTNAQIFRTLDGGKTWVRMTELDSMRGVVTDIYFDSIHHGYALAFSVPPSSDPNPYRHYRGKGVFETHDTGRTWKKITPVDVFEPHYWTIYGIGQTIAVQGLYGKRSTDRGKTWFDWACERGASYEVSGTPEGLIFFAGGRGCPVSSSISTYSKDSGKTWTTYENTEINFSHGGDVGGRHYIHRATGRIILSTYEGGTTPGTWFSRLLVSDDTGKSWTKKWEYYYNGIHDNGIGFGEINGDGCAIYVQLRTNDTTLGLLRSTDLGETWEDVGGPRNPWDKGISVVGNGAVVYAVGYHSHPIEPNYFSLYKTRTGGDGKLSTIPRPEMIELSHKLFSSASLPSTSRDTLHVRMCDSASLEVLFNYREDCSFARLREIDIEGLPKHLYRTSTRVRPFTDKLTDSANAVIYPEAVGTYSIKVRARYEHDAKTYRDTSFNLVLVVHPNPSTLTIAGKKEYDLGIQRLCNITTVIDSFSISATGCDPYTVKSIRFEEERPGSGYSFSAAQNVTLSPDGTQRFFYVSFTPSAAGTFTGRIIIEREDGSDTLFVTASAADDDRMLVMASDTVESRMCEFGETVIRITNTSCRETVVDSLSLLPPLYLEAGQLPLTIGAGKTIELRVRFEPEVLGSQTINATAFLRFMAQNEAIAFDTLLRVTVLGLRGIPQTVVSDTTIDLGKVSICSEQEFSIPVASIGCDTLHVNTTSLGSPSQGFTITSLSNDRIPVSEVAQILMRFVPPSVGAFSTDLSIQTNAGNRRVTLTGEGIAGQKTLASSLSTINFGETNICEEKDSTVQLTNTGCDTLVITDAEIDENFEIVDIEYPVKLAPGESVELPIVTIVDTSGKPTVLNGQLIITSTADNTLQPIVLTRSLYYPTRLRIEAIDEANGKVGDEVKFNLILEGEVPASMSALHFDFLHDNDLLSFTDLTGDGLNIMNTTGHADQRQSFTFSPVKAGVIGEMTFKTFLAQAENTTLTFDNIRFDAAGITVAPECIAVISDSGSRFNYIYSCGEGMVKNYLVNNQILIRSISPNPASEEIVLDVSDDVTSIVLYDAMGKEVLRNTSEKRLDTRSLSSGIYYLTARSTHTAQTKRVLIER